MMVVALSEEAVVAVTGPGLLSSLLRDKLRVAEGVPWPMLAQTIHTFSLRKI